MTEENWEVLEEIVRMCRQDFWNSINVASQKRRQAIIAAWEKLDQHRIGNQNGK